MERNGRVTIEPELRDAAERAADTEGSTLNEFVNRAVAEKLSFTDPRAYFEARAARARRADFIALLDRADDVGPTAGDEFDKDARRA